MVRIRRIAKNPNARRFSRNLNARTILARFPDGTSRKITPRQFQIIQRRQLQQRQQQGNFAPQQSFSERAGHVIDTTTFNPPALTSPDLSAVIGLAMQDLNGERFVKRR